ncbi:TPA: ion channel protein Tsx, partial [Escherichia coli]|nr:ion channel protein Tsx [Escherichia coli]
MSAKRRLLIACTLITAIYHFPAYSSLEYKGTFGSINAGYADWNSGFVNTHRGEVWK